MGHGVSASCTLLGKWIDVALRALMDRRGS